VSAAFEYLVVTCSFRLWRAGLKTYSLLVNLSNLAKLEREFYISTSTGRIYLVKKKAIAPFRGPAVSGYRIDWPVLLSSLWPIPIVVIATFSCHSRTALRFL